MRFVQSDAKNQGVFVVVSGEYREGTGEVEVEVLGLPPAEGREASKQYLQNLELIMTPDSNASNGKFFS